MNFLLLSLNKKKIYKQNCKQHILYCAQASSKMSSWLRHFNSYYLPNYKNNQNVLHRSIGYSDKKYMIHRSTHSTHSIFRYDFYFQPIIKAKQIRVYLNTNITLPPPIRQQKRY